MKHHRFGIIAALVLALAVPLAQAIERGSSPAGVEYVSGGVGDAELRALHTERGKYSFWLTTAALKSGAHLASVRVRIVDTKSRQTVLEHTMDGPWLFAALPLGRYEVEAALLNTATGRLEVQRGVTTIHPGDHHQMLLYFATSDEVSGEPGPFEGNPYKDPPKK
jgi:hypothetical protein